MSNNSPSDHYFTKYLFKTGLECPTRLYYQAHGYPENQSSVPFINHLRNNKYLLRQLARAFYPKGVQVHGNSIEEAAKISANKLQKKNIVLFDAVFTQGCKMLKVPILQKQGKAVKIYQIQTKAFNPDKHRLLNHHGAIYTKWKDYLMGFAYQLSVISSLNPEWQLEPILVVPNKGALSQHDDLHTMLTSDIKNPELQDERDLLVYLPVKPEVDRILSGKEWKDPTLEGQAFELVLSTLVTQFKSKKKSPPEPGYKCKYCAFNLQRDRTIEERSGFNECQKDAFNRETQQMEPVFDLIGPGIKGWIEQGIFFQEGIPDEEVADIQPIENGDGSITERNRQALQIMKVKGREVPQEIIRPQLFKELEKWEYPIHFLDFEAGNYALPIRRNRKPYDLVIFQFSCHTLYKDGRWQHHQWIDPMQGAYPNMALVRELKAVPGILEGTIVQYSDFERYALKTIRKELKKEPDEYADAQELVAWIEQIIKRHDSNQKDGPYLADLSRMVKNQYYNHHMQHSLSIKDVLRSVMAQSDELKRIYSQAYTSTNFDAMIWWQQDEHNAVISPYALLVGDEDEGGVRRGTEAMVAYAASLKGQLSITQKKNLQQTLLRYCELDTLAMLMIFQHWKALMPDSSGT